MARPDNFTDTYYKSKPRLVRRLRTITDDAQRQLYCDQLEAHNIPVDTFIYRFNEDPKTVMQIRLDDGVNEPGLPPPSVDPADYPISSDLIIPKRPFSQWPQEQGDPKIHNAVGTRYASTDNLEIGAEFHDGEILYEKLLMVNEGGSFATASADPSAIPFPYGSPYWFRVE